MSITEESKQILREIGLNTYEIDAYLALLEGGQMTAMEISKKAKVPYSKIYEVLNSLKEKGWIKSVESRPNKYYPLPPLEALATTKIKLEDKYESWKQTMVSQLQPLYEKRELVERPDILILHGQQAVMAKLEETLRKATKEIMIAAPNFAKDTLASTTLPLEVLQKTRLNIKLMVAGKPEEWNDLKKFKDMAELRFRDKMFGGGIIVDGKEAMLFLGEEKPSLVIWSNHVGLVQFARDYFQFLWDTSQKI
ncbi:MAG: helix-turn-helix domain-containing protein [Candidatus Bathyarchaeota archaeon]|nr:helix-turn-helix domain-containing protein [Candidatus Bathyarchaeota archaeon]MDI6805075.1 helix-turn-helix domain-containing protein [Candidatus Bathyarchaeia archaeon]